MGEQDGKLGIYLPLGVVAVELVEILKRGNSTLDGGAMSLEQSPLMHGGGATDGSVKELARDAVCGISGHFVKYLIDKLT